MNRPTRDITQAEWDAYEWFNVTTMSDPGPVYRRGLKRTEPPRDGFVYERAPVGPSDTEQRWVRVQVAEREEQDQNRRNVWVGPSAGVVVAGQFDSWGRPIVHD